jgi:protein TonB
MSGKKHWRAYVPTIIGALLALLLIGFIVKVIVEFVDKKPARSEKKIQPITLLKPPPPPPPPPKVEKPPEPEIKQKIEEPKEPEPEPETPPDEAPARDLGLDAEGTAGSDGFGLAARKGGTGLFGGGGGNAYSGYTTEVKKVFLDLLNEDDELRRKGYFALFKISLNPDGSVERTEISQSSNDEDIDARIRRQLNKYRGSFGPTPPGMNLKIKFKFKSSGVR